MCPCMTTSEETFTMCKWGTKTNMHPAAAINDSALSSILEFQGINATESLRIAPKILKTTQNYSCEKHSVAFKTIT